MKETSYPQQMDLFGRRIDDCIKAAQGAIEARSETVLAQTSEIARQGRELEEVIEILNHNAKESQILENRVDALDEAICPQVAARLEKLERMICQAVAFDGPTINAVWDRIAKLEDKAASPTKEQDPTASLSPFARRMGGDRRQNLSLRS